MSLVINNKIRFCLTAENKDIPTLLEMLADSDQSVRVAAVQSLGRLGEVSVCRKLFELLDTTDIILYRTVRQVLDRLRAPALYDLYRELIAHTSATIRAYAIECLGALGDKRIVTDLTAKLNDTSPEVRIAVIWSLTRLTEKETLFTLIFPSVLDDDVKVKETAFSEINKFFTVSDKNTVFGFLHHTEPYYRYFARRWLVEYYRKSQDTELITEIKKCLRERNKEVRIDAIKLIKELNDQKIVTALNFELRNIWDPELKEEINKLFFK